MKKISVGKFTALPVSVGNLFFTPPRTRSRHATGGKKEIDGIPGSCTTRVFYKKPLYKQPSAGH